jgi:hypothetical protein
MLILDGFPQCLPALPTIRVTLPGRLLRFCHQYWRASTRERFAAHTLTPKRSGPVARSFVRPKCLAANYACSVRSPNPASRDHRWADLTLRVSGHMEGRTAVSGRLTFERVMDALSLRVRKQALRGVHIASIASYQHRYTTSLA